MTQTYCVFLEAIEQFGVLNDGQFEGLFAVALKERVEKICESKIRFLLQKDLYQML